MIRGILLLFAIFPIFSSACEDEYFASINMKEVPERPFQKMSKETAMERESQGEHYYIKRTCDDGKLVSIIHRQYHKDMTKADYYYENGNLVKLVMTNTEGEVFEHDL